VTASSDAGTDVIGEFSDDMAAEGRRKFDAILGAAVKGRANTWLYNLDFSGNYKLRFGVTGKAAPPQSKKPSS
jgi:hypothetical protein